MMTQIQTEMENDRKRIIELQKQFYLIICCLPLTSISGFFCNKNGTCKKPMSDKQRSEIKLFRQAKTPDQIGYGSLTLFSRLS